MKEGATARFELELSHRDVPVTWYKNDVKIHPSRTAVAHVDGEKHVLEMKEVTLDDTCQIKAEAKGIPSMANLTVIGNPPVLHLSPVCPPLPVCPPMCVCIYVCSTHCCLLHTVVVCVVHGESPRNVPLPEGDAYFTVKLQDFTAVEKDQVVLGCELSKDVEVVWYHNEAEVKTSKGVAVKAEGKRRTLVIKKVGDEDKGAYVCDCGTDKTTATLHIEGKESVLGNLPLLVAPSAPPPNQNLHTHRQLLLTPPPPSSSGSC